MLLGESLADPSASTALSALESTDLLLAAKDIGPVAGPVVALLTLGIPFALMNLIVVPAMQALAGKGDKDK